MIYTVSVFENKVWEGDFPDSYLSTEQAINAIRDDWQSQQEGVVYMVADEVKVVDMFIVEGGLLLPYSFSKEGK